MASWKEVLPCKKSKAPPSHPPKNIYVYKKCNQLLRTYSFTRIVKKWNRWVRYETFLYCISPTILRSIMKRNYKKNILIRNQNDDVMYCIWQSKICMSTYSRFTFLNFISFFSNSALARDCLRLRIPWYCLAFT